MLDLQPRLFELDMQLIADSILMLIAFVIPVIIILLIVIFLIKAIRGKNCKNDCKGCSYRNNNPYNN